MADDEMWSKWALSDSEDGVAKKPDAIEQELLNSAQRAWPHVLGQVRRELAGKASTAEKRSLATEVWEGVLRSVSRTMRRDNENRKISNMEAYLVGVFHHRLNRVLSKEQKRQKAIEFVPSANDLAELEGAQDRDWVANLETEILVKEVLSHMEDWARKVLVSQSYGYSWSEIAATMGLTEQQLKMRFRYSVEKTRKRLLEATR